MTDNSRLNLAQVATLGTAIQSMINSSCIISYGIIKGKPENSSGGIVNVELSVANSKKGIKVITCVLAGIASSTFTVDVVPEVGDKVLVLYPDKFDPEMFDLSKTETIINKNAKGYNLFGGIAILINQYRKNQHNNYIQCKDGELTVKLAYDKNAEGNDKNHLTIATDKDGAVTVSNSKGTVNLDKDGYLSYHNTDSQNTNKPELEFTSSGFTLKDINGCSIESSTSVGEGTKTVINGKLTIKK